MRAAYSPKHCGTSHRSSNQIVLLQQTSYQIGTEESQQQLMTPFIITIFLVSAAAPFHCLIFGCVNMFGLMVLTAWHTYYMEIWGLLFPSGSRWMNLSTCVTWHIPWSSSRWAALLSSSST